MLGRIRERLPARWLIFGCLLPDLIDKPLFYLVGPTKLISGSRTFGHTFLFLLALFLLALLSRRAAVWAIFAGVATHLALDIAGEVTVGASPDSSIWIALLFPLLGVRFPVAHFHTLLEHLRVSAENLYVIFGEVAGGAILLRAWILRRRQSA